MGIFNRKQPDVIIHDNKIVFTVDGKEETIKLSDKGFFFKGEKVDDKGEVYEAFKKWLNSTGMWKL